MFQRKPKHQTALVKDFCSIPYLDCVSSSEWFSFPELFIKCYQSATHHEGFRTWISKTRIGIHAACDFSLKLDATRKLVRKEHLFGRKYDFSDQLVIRRTVWTRRKRVDNVEPANTPVNCDKISYNQMEHQIIEIFIVCYFASLYTHDITSTAVQKPIFRMQFEITIIQ